MTLRPPWSLLGIEPTAEAPAIRRAYSERLKAMDVDNDVSGFAALRSARDQALRLAKAMADAPVDTVRALGPQGAGADDAGDAGDAGQAPVPLEGEPGPTAPNPGRWTYAAPQLPGSWPEDESLLSGSLAARSEAAREGEASAMLERMAWAAAAVREGVSGAGIPLTTIDPFTAPLLSGHVGDDALGLRPGETPAERLASLLDPESEDAGAQLTEGETRQALRALRAILDEVAQSHVTRQQQIEDWLAEILARGWPRSAPLLEEANVAFGWEREWGAHDARPAVEFLGARLRGFRFQQKVAEPEHRFHKAWVELQRPGPAGVLRGLRRPSRGDIDALLRGVRKHFPELESHFDDQRVASWEGGHPLAPFLLAILGGIAFLFLVLVLGDAKDPSAGSGNTPTITSDAPFDLESGEATVAAGPDEAQVTEAVQAAVSEGFGDDRSLDWLWQHQPELAQTITANARYALGKGEDRAAIVRKTIEIVRERSYRSGRTLTGADFNTAMRLRLGQLQAAREVSDSACIELLNSGWIDGDTSFPAALRSKERAYAARLVEQGLLTAPGRSTARSSMIPGELIGKVIRATRLNEEQVGIALRGEGSRHNRCAVSIALLEATLGWQGDERHDILMIL